MTTTASTLVTPSNSQEEHSMHHSSQDNANSINWIRRLQSGEDVTQSDWHQRSQFKVCVLSIYVFVEIILIRKCDQ